MNNKYVDKAKEGMGTIEKLISGLPGIRGYRDKDLRRDADYRLRQMIAGGLEEQKAKLYDLQKQLLKSGGLSWVDDVDGAVTKLQTLADRVKTASYGYAGLFSAQKIQDVQLDALHRFDVALMARVQEVKDAIAGLEAAIGQKDGINSAIDGLTAKLTELNNLFSQRANAVDDPDLLIETGAPALDDTLLAAAFPTTDIDTDTGSNTQSWDVGAATTPTP